LSGRQGLLRRLAKLPGLRIHDLRYSAASFMVNSGVDLFAVGKVLGHANYQSTQRCESAFKAGPPSSCR